MHHHIFKEELLFIIKSSTYILIKLIRYIMAVILLNIVSWLDMHQLPCLIKKTFHVACPGCGLQRSIISLLQGKVLESIYFYPALLPLLFLISIIILNSKWQLLFLQKCITFGIPSVFGIILLSYIYKLAS